MSCVSSVHIGPSKTACIGRSTSSSTRIWPATARTTPRPTSPYSDVLPSMSPEPTPIQAPPCASNSSAPDGTIPSSSSSLATCDSPALQGRVKHSAPLASRRLLLRADQLAVDQAFGDLDRVQRGALAQIVGDAPQHEPVLHRGILADPADIGGVLAGAFVRRDVAARLALADHQAPRRVAQDVARLVGRE